MQHDQFEPDESGGNAMMHTTIIETNVSATVGNLQYL